MLQIEQNICISAVAIGPVTRHGSQSYRSSNPTYNYFQEKTYKKMK